MILATIFKIALPLLLLYVLNKFGVFSYLNKKIAVITQTTKEYQHEKKQRKSFLKKLVKSQKSNNEI